MLRRLPRGRQTRLSRRRAADSGSAPRGRPRTTRLRRHRHLVQRAAGPRLRIAVLDGRVAATMRHGARAGRAIGAREGDPEASPDREGSVPARSVREVLAATPTGHRTSHETIAMSAGPASGPRTSAVGRVARSVAIDPGRHPGHRDRTDARPTGIGRTGRTRATARAGRRSIDSSSIVLRARARRVRVRRSPDRGHHSPAVLDAGPDRVHARRGAARRIARNSPLRIGTAARRPRPTACSRPTRNWWPAVAP